MEISSGLDVSDINKIRKVFLKYPQVQKALLYGSRAMGNFKPASDIDLALIGNDIDLTLLQSIEMDLDDLLLPYKFDITVFDKLTNLELKDHIKRVGKELYNKP